MRAFEFPLRQALEWRRRNWKWRRTSCASWRPDVEEWPWQAVRLDLVRGRAEEAVRQVRRGGGRRSLGAGGLPSASDGGDAGAGARQAECEQQMASQRQRRREAQRQCRLLEKLEQRRRAEWRVEADKEMENLAAESFLARWNRQAD